MASEKRKAAPRGSKGSKSAGSKRASGPRGSGSKKTSSSRAPKGGTRKAAIDALGSTRVKDRSRLPEKMKSSLRLRIFLEAAVFDFILVVVVSVALVFSVSYGFHSAWDYRGNLLFITALVVPLAVALFAGSWSKGTVVPSAVATAVLSVAYIAVAVATSSEPFFTADAGVNDVEGSYGIFAIIVVVVTVVVFLLSRRTVGLVFLMLLACVACGLVQFLYRDWISDQPGIAATLVVLFGLGMLFVYQCYRQSIYSANRAKRTSFPAAFAFSAVICAVCIAVGFAVFYGVVATSGLSTPEVKMFESYVSPPVSDQARDYETMQYEGDNTSDETNDETGDTTDEGEGAENPLLETGTSMLESTIVGQLAATFAGLDLDEDDPDDEEDLNKYIKAIVYTAIIIAILTALFITAVVLLWRYRRTLRLKRIAKRSRRYQVYYLYTFLIERFRRVRIAKPDHLTPLEFAAGFSKPMLPYTRDTGGVDFIEVSSLYQDAVFGGIEPTDEQMERLVTYYRCFYKNAFKETAWPKWIFWRFWRL